MGPKAYGALFTWGAKYDRGDDTPALEKQQTRRRIRIGLEAADAFEQAVREGLVVASFAAADNDCDPLEMAVEFMAVGDVEDDRLNPVFRFNLRDAFWNAVKDTDWSIANHYRVVADGLEKFLAEMRAELAMFSKAEAEDRVAWELRAAGCEHEFLDNGLCRKCGWGPRT